MTATRSGDDLRSRATGSLGWIVMERWGSRILTLVVFTALSRLVAPAQFGLISLATVFIAFLQVFVDSGFSKSLIQRRELSERDASTAFWTALGMAVVLYVAVFLSAPLLGDLFHEPQLPAVLRWLCLALPLNALSLTPAALLEREFGFKALSVRQFASSIAGSVAAIAFAVAGFGVWALVAQTLVASVASVATLWAATSWRPSLRFSLASLKDLSSTGFGILGIDLLDAVQGNLDKFLIGAFFSAEVLGYYFLAQRVGTILVELVTSVIARVSLTTFSRLQHDVPRLNRVLRQLTFVATAVAIPIFGLVAVLAPQIVAFVFGSQWLPAVPIMWILAPTEAIASIMYFDRSALLATGHARAALGIAFLQNAVGIALVFALVPFGIAGVAFSRWSRIVTWPVRLVVLRRQVGVEVGGYLLQPARALLAIAPVILGVALLQTTAWAHGAAAFWTFAAPVGLLGLAVYTGLLLLLAGQENRALVLRTASAALATLRARLHRRTAPATPSRIEPEHP